MPGYDDHAREDVTRDLKAAAERLGFDACGVSEAEPLDEEARKLERWLLEGRYATMDWMADHFDERTDPTVLVDGARSVISVLQNYYQPAGAVEPGTVNRDGDAGGGDGADHATPGGGRRAPGVLAGTAAGDPAVGRISRYAWGDDYHEVMKEQLYRLFHWLQERVGAELHGRAFVDSAPVMDKVWAARSGLGWQGKHTNLLNREMGSYFFIGELIVDLPLAYDDPVPDYCGSCTRCVDACPTDAIYEPYALDASRCISYLTIEHEGLDVPDAIESDLHNWIFGCDVCQDVCPWNKFRQSTRQPEYLPREGVRDTDLRDWVEISLDEFERTFKGSPVTRAGYDGFLRNVRHALNNLEAAGA